MLKHLSFLNLVSVMFLHFATTYNKNHRARRNPYTIIQRQNQGCFAINVMAGIIGNHVFGTIYFPSLLTSHSIFGIFTNYTLFFYVEEIFKTPQLLGVGPERV